MSEPETEPTVTPLLATAYGLVALLVLAAAVSADSTLPAAPALVLFVLLGLWAENWGVPLPSAITVSPSLMVVMAAIAAMESDGMLMGVAAVGVANGMTLTLLRQRRYPSVIANSSQYLISSLAGAVV